MLTALGCCSLSITHVLVKRLLEPTLREIEATNHASHLDSCPCEFTSLAYAFITRE